MEIQTPPVRPAGSLSVRGAAEGPLQHLDLQLRLGRLVCFTGRSGSGSRAMAVDVLCGESRRRYLMALSPFERQALGAPARVAVEEVGGLPPAMLVDGTVTRRGTVAAFLQLEMGLARLWREHGRLACPGCGGRCRELTAEEGAAELSEAFAGEPVLVLAPWPLASGAPSAGALAELRRAGFVRLWREGRMVRLDEAGEEPAPAGAAALEVVVDRVAPAPDQGARLAEALRNARAIGRGRSRAVGLDSGRRLWLNPDLSCQDCGTSYAQLRTEDFAPGRPERHPVAAGVELGGVRLEEFDRLTLAAAAAALRRWAGEHASADVLAAPMERAVALGLGHVAVAADAAALSTGEQRRLVLALCLSRGLVGMLYVFDAPTAGLTRSEAAACARGLRQLVEQGNTVVALDHAPELLHEADEVHAFVDGRLEPGWPAPAEGSARPRRTEPQRHLLRVHATARPPLVKMDLALPLERLVAVTGPSASGKTTLLRRLAACLRRRSGRPEHGLEVRAEGGGRISRVVEIGLGGGGPDRPLLDELGLFEAVAAQYAQGPAARVRGYPPGWFRLDQPGGRCPTCAGCGALRSDLEFLEDLELPCPTCGGRRYRSELLEVTVRGLDISELLETPIDRACQVFAHEPAMAPRLEAARRCGLGRHPLGRPAARLERDEYLRLRLAVELPRASTRDLIVLEHPTAGTHPEDVRQLVAILDELVDRGASVLAEVAEEAVASQADWVIRMDRGVPPQAGVPGLAGEPTMDHESGRPGAARGGPDARE